MHTIMLEKLNNTRMEIHNDSIIIWCVHNKDYTYGQYYKIDKNNNIFLCNDKETEYYEYQLQPKFIGDKNYENTIKQNLFRQT